MHRLVSLAFAAALALACDSSARTGKHVDAGGSAAVSSGGTAPAVGGAGGVGMPVGGAAMGGAMVPGSGGSANGNSGRGGTGSAGTPSGSSGTGGSSHDAGQASGSSGPCDIYAAAGNACVAAHSTVRALYAAYAGKLYQVRRADNMTKDITVLSAGGFADFAAQDAFCSGMTCVITAVYDQSGHGNDLVYQGPGSTVPSSDQSQPTVATNESLTVHGNKVYSLYMKPGNSFWRDGSQSGLPTGSQPEELYMVTSGTHYNNECCFDYGNSETDRKADGPGAMDAINFGNECWFASTAPCTGSGPWVQADLEWGLFAGGSTAANPNNIPMTSKYVTAMLKNNGTTEFALKGGNAQSGDLTTLYKGQLPNGNYSPMKKQGAIVLGSGGDCCKPGGGANLSEGTFYEGAIVSGYPSEATDSAVQANIVATGYGK